MGSTVRELQARMTSREFTEWRAFYNLEPFGPERIDVAVGMHSAMVANMHRKKGSTPFKLKDFLPRYGVKKGAPVQSAKSMLGMFRSRTKSLKREHPNYVTIAKSPEEARAAKLRGRQEADKRRAESGGKSDASRGEAKRAKRRDADPR